MSHGRAVFGNKQLVVLELDHCKCSNVFKSINKSILNADLVRPTFLTDDRDELSRIDKIVFSKLKDNRYGSKLHSRLLSEFEIKDDIFTVDETRSLDSIKLINC